MPAFASPIPPCVPSKGRRPMPCPPGAAVSLGQAQCPEWMIPGVAWLPLCPEQLTTGRHAQNTEEMTGVGTYLNQKVGAADLKFQVNWAKSGHCRQATQTRNRKRTDISFPVTPIPGNSDLSAR